MKYKFSIVISDMRWDLFHDISQSLIVILNNFQYIHKYDSLNVIGHFLGPGTKDIELPKVLVYKSHHLRTERHERCTVYMLEYYTDCLILSSLINELQ